MDAQGQKTYQIAGKPHIVERREEIPEGDIKLVMEQTGKTAEEAKKALEKTNGESIRKIIYSSILITSVFIVFSFIISRFIRLRFEEYKLNLQKEIENKICNVHGNKLSLYLPYFSFQRGSLI